MDDSIGKLVLIAAILCFGYVAWHWWQAAPATQQEGLIPAAQRQPAADFSLAEARTGAMYKISQLKGSVILLNFFGATCLPCRQEAPVLQRIHSQYKGKGLIVMGVNAWRESAADVADFARSHGLEYPVLVDPKGAAPRSYGVRGVPHTALIARDGRIAAVRMGSGPGIENALRKDVDTLLAENAQSAESAPPAAPAEGQPADSVAR